MCLLLPSSNTVPIGPLVINNNGANNRQAQRVRVDLPGYAKLILGDCNVEGYFVVFPGGERSYPGNVAVYFKWSSACRYQAHSPFTRCLGRKVRALVFIGGTEEQGY